MTRALSISLFAIAACTDAPPVEPPIEPILQIDVDPFELGPITCGQQRTTSFVVSNPSGATLELVMLSTLPGVTVSPPRLEVAPFHSARVEVTAAVPQVATPGFVSRGDIVIGGNGGSATVPVSFSAAGAIVTVEPAVDFGELVTNAMVNRSFEVSVTGTTGATVTLGAPTSPNFRVLHQPSAQLAANTSHTFGVRLETGATEQVHTATLPLAITGDLCAPPPAEIALSGIATNELLTISTTAIDFGTPACAVFTTRKIEMTNHGPTDVSFTVERTDPAGFISGEFSSVFLGGRLEAGETDGATVVHARVPFELDLPIGTYAAQLEVELNQAVTRTIPIFTTISRPIIGLSTRALDGGAAGIGTIERTFVVTNTGDQPDDIIVDATPGSANTTAEVSPQAFQLAPNQSQTITVKATTTTTARALVNVGLLGKCEAAGVLLSTD